MREDTTDPVDDDVDSDREADSGVELLAGESLAEARQYGRLQLTCDIADKLLDVGFLAVMAFAVARPLDEWLLTFSWLKSNDTLRLTVLYVITFGLHVGVSMPLSFYAGHVLEHRFGLSTQKVRGWLWRYVKRTGLASVFGLLMFLALFWLIWWAGGLWWLIAAALFFVVSVLLGQLMPVWIIPLFYKVEELPQGELSDRFKQLADGTGLSIRGVFRIELSAETTKANAMLTGMGKTRRVLLGDTLLDEFSADEIEVIFAHEVGHHVFRHIRKMIVTGGLYSAVGLYLCDRLLVGYAGSSDYTSMPVHALPFVMLTLTLFSLALEPLQNAVSRHFERQCDQYALDRTGKKHAYVSAFRKLARLNKDNPHPHPLAVMLFHSHPPIAERLAMAEEGTGGR